jgi:tetratricopeptide (TPR) repeat protein
VTPVVVVVALAAMFAIVLFGAVAPYRRQTVPELEPLADPLEDRRLALLVTLKDLQSARDAAAIEADEYLRLRDDAETRMAKVLRAIDERRRKEDEPTPAAAGTGRRRSPARYLAIAMIAAIALSIGIVPSLLRSLHDRAGTDLEITLDDLAARVRQNPHDAAARIDYGYRLLNLGRFGDAYKQFSAALAIQPYNVEALANFGLLLHLSGYPLDGLQAEDKALEIQPDYPEALFIKGTILLQGLDRPKEAIGYLQRYLDAAPYGSYAEFARDRIARAQAELAGAGPGTTPSATPSPPVPSPQLTVPTG